MRNVFFLLSVDFIGLKCTPTLEEMTSMLSRDKKHKLRLDADKIAQ